MGEGATAFLIRDHERLDALLRRLRGCDAGEARAVCAELDGALARHLRWEEELLFPLLERRTGQVHVGRTEGMRMEHRVLRERLARIGARVRAGQAAGDTEVEHLVALLEQHRREEERLLYPEIDARVPASELAEALARMRADA